MKDEAGGKIIEEFVGLRPKLYSIKMHEDKKEEKKCKGTKKSVIKKKKSHTKISKIASFKTNPNAIHEYHQITKIRNFHRKSQQDCSFCK